MSLKQSFVAIFMFCSHSALAMDSSDPVQKINKCQKEIRTSLTTMGSADQWNQVAPREVPSELWRTPTKKIGQWIELQIGDAGENTVYFWNENEFQTLKWDQACVKTQIKKELKKKDNKGEVISDQDLEKMVQSGKSFLLYSWSPAMVYSFRDYQVFKKVADQNKMTFTSIVSSREPKDLVKAALKEDKDKQLSTKSYQGIELLMREATVHYPSALVIHQKRISRLPIVGIYDFEKLDAKVKIEMTRLENATNK